MKALASDHADALAKLSVLSDLRGIGRRVRVEIEKMGISVNLEESTLIRPTIDRVREETTRKNSIDFISRTLGARFEGSLPNDLRERLKRLDQSQLETVIDRSAVAISVEEALSGNADLSTDAAPASRAG